MKKLTLILLSVFLFSCEKAQFTLGNANKVALEKFDRFEFRSDLSRKETATVNDLVILVSQSYKEHRDLYDADQWYRAFVHLGWISEGLEMEEPCTRSQVGRLVCGRLNLQGNLFLKLAGPSDRYGFREMLNRRFITRGYPNEYIQGSTLMNVQSKSTAWTKKTVENKEAYDRWTDKKLTEVFGDK